MSYPTSLLLAVDGTFFVGTRGGVVRLTRSWPDAPRYTNGAAMIRDTLFIEIVTSMTGDAGDLVGHESSEFKDGDLAEHLFDYAHLQLSIVLTPRLMQLRRLVIGEVSRFPDLARVLYERGPARAMSALASNFESLAKRGLLKIDDPKMAASHCSTSAWWAALRPPCRRTC